MARREGDTERQGEGKDSTWEAVVILESNSEVISHSFCHILFSRNESLKPAYTQVKGN